MEASKKQQLADLQTKIPDIEKNLDVIKHIKQRKEEGDDKMVTNYELNDTLYSKATVDVQNLNSVYLWLGAEVMLEYNLEDATELLNERLKRTKNNYKLSKKI